MGRAVQVNKSRLLPFDNDGKVNPAEMGGASADMIGTRGKSEPDGAFVKAVDVVDHFFGNSAVLRSDPVPAVMAGGTGIDEVAPGRINDQKAVALRVGSRLRSGANGLQDDRLWRRRAAGKQQGRQGKSETGVHRKRGGVESWGLK